MTPVYTLFLLLELLLGLVSPVSCETADRVYLYQGSMVWEIAEPVASAWGLRDGDQMPADNFGKVVLWDARYSLTEACACATLRGREDLVHEMCEEGFEPERPRLET